ncbi:MAG: hypothetical protein ACLQSR_06575, partial [Limisphaerales bacterium]
EARSWCVRVWTQTIERFRCERVFREGAENSTRGGCAPRSVGVEGLLAGAREHHHYARKAVERAVRLGRLPKTALEKPLQPVQNSPAAVCGFCILEFADYAFIFVVRTNPEPKIATVVKSCQRTEA